MGSRVKFVVVRREFEECCCCLSPREGTKEESFNIVLFFSLSLSLSLASLFVVD